MPDFREQIEDIRFVLSSKAWTDSFAPSLEDKRQQFIQLLLNPSDDRQSVYPDDYIRAAVNVIDWLLAWGPGVLEDWDANSNVADNILEEVSKSYQQRATDGRIGPY